MYRFGNIRRKRKLNTFNLGLNYKTIQPFLGTLLSMLPAFFYGCCGADGGISQASAACLSRISLPVKPNETGTLDFFVFRADRTQRLDSYFRVDRPDSWDGTVMSGSGERIITAIANSGREREEWSRMDSRSFLKGACVILEDERRESPCMSGEISVNTEETGISLKEELELVPFISEVVLNSLSCDFTGKPYDGERLSDIKVYLTNVNAECTILEDGIPAPRRIINAGGLNEGDLAAFKEPGLVMQELSGEVGKTAVKPDIRLWCYQSCHPSESPGTPFTRLVIEGRISGHRYYWPISVNRDSGEEEAGVRRNRSYIYDIRITRKGTDNPDIPVNTEETVFKKEVSVWKEIKEYSVSF